MAIPERVEILLSGIPATGKSEFARYLARAHGFAHYDLECHPRGWPHAELKGIWDNDRYAFMAQLRKYHPRIVIDWGFNPLAISLVEQLQDCGVKLVWFNGDIAQARSAFERRGGIDVTIFERQVEAIEQAGYPATLNNCTVVDALSGNGTFLARDEIESILFP